MHVLEALNYYSDGKVRTQTQSLVSRDGDFPAQVSDTQGTLYIWMNTLCSSAVSIGAKCRVHPHV